MAAVSERRFPDAEARHAVHERLAIKEASQSPLRRLMSSIMRLYSTSQRAVPS